MKQNVLEQFKGKNVLLLQGPFGFFFYNFAKDLRAAGATVHKINFNGGDLFFYPRGGTRFSDRMENWPAFFSDFAKKHDIDTVFIYGDCRPIHQIPEAREDLDTYVFEEGYIRPDYITLEKYGVNGHSKIPRDPEFYREHVAAEQVATQKVNNSFPSLVRYAFTYHTFSFFLWPLFTRYRHHRRLDIFEGLYWIRSLFRKFKYAYKERKVIERLIAWSSKKYFLLPLQVFNDSQINVHSDFESIHEFMENCIASFARHAPADTLLVLKHHPMDRAYTDYTKFLRRMAKKYGLEDRLVYVHDLHLPMLLQHARGVVMINSTVGISSLHHGTPTKTCGDAIYDMEGLTYQGSLDDFWNDAEDFKVDRDLYLSFVSYIVNKTQLNGSFYKKLEDVNTHSGIVLSRNEAIDNEYHPASDDAATNVVNLGEAIASYEEDDPDAAVTDNATPQKTVHESKTAGQGRKALLERGSG